MICKSIPHRWKKDDQSVQMFEIRFSRFNSQFSLFTISDKCKLVKGPKPLTHFKFYLDIEKHHIENKIEKTIRELGGVSKIFDIRIPNCLQVFIRLL